MRIFKINFKLREDGVFRVGWYIGKTLIKIGNYIIAKDINFGEQNGAKIMKFGIYTDLNKRFAPNPSDES